MRFHFHYFFSCQLPGNSGGITCMACFRAAARQGGSPPRQLVGSPLSGETDCYRRRSRGPAEASRDMSEEHLLFRKNLTVNSFLTVTGQFSVIIGIVLCVFGSCEHHSKLRDGDAHPFETDTRGRCSSLMTFLYTGQPTETGRPTYLIHVR